MISKSIDFFLIERDFCKDDGLHLLKRGRQGGGGREEGDDRKKIHWVKDGRSLNVRLYKQDKPKLSQIDSLWIQ